jgi:hypothetical protein
LNTEHIDVTTHDFPPGVDSIDQKINFIRDEIHRFENEAPQVHNLTLQATDRSLQLGPDKIVENLKIILRKLEEQQP